MIFWIIWFALGIGMIAFSLCMLLPRIMIKMHAATLPVRDRAIGRLSEGNGAVVMYEPAASVRPYIKSYRIGKDDSGTYFVGEWARKIAFAHYEIVAYNAHNDIIDVIRVKEKFNGGETTHVTKLPAKADYVTLRLVCADDTPFPAERRKFNLRFVLWLAVLCFILAAVTDFLLWLCSSFALRCLYGFDTSISPPASMWAYVLGFTALGVVAVTFIIVLAHFFLLRRRGDRER